MDHLLNFYQSTDQIGTAGQPTADQLTQVAVQGYSAVVNLAMHDSDGAIPEEGSIVSSLGMSYFHMPIPFEAPCAKHVKRFFDIMQALEGERVFVHCAVNARVSAFMYKYLTLVKGMPPEESQSPLLCQWQPQMDDRWKSIMELRLNEIK